MKPLTRLLRMIHISFVLSKHGLDDILLATHLFRPVRSLRWFSLARLNGRHQKPKGERIREALEELGPIFVKFGQLLSTRYDILPENIIHELVKLQDQVPPFSGLLAKKMVEDALKKPILEIFNCFETTPLASASIAQVHSATLIDGRTVVVKILRPNIHKIIKRDIELLKTLANLAHRYWKNVRSFKPREIVAEFERTLINELDLMREAANASQLKRNFLDSPSLHVPEIHWPLTTHKLLVMERVYGISLLDLELLKKQGFNLKQLAKQIIDLFFTQVFRDCFFHADVHPGNILVANEHPHIPKFIMIDFGIVGTLSPQDQHYLAENILAFLKRDYRRVAMLHRESGWVPITTRIDEFEAAIRTVCEPIFEQPLQEISFGQLLFRLFQMAAHYQINIQPQLILLQKTLINIEGLSRQLDPNIDLWGTAKPFLETWMKNQIGIPSLIRKIKTYGPYWIEKLPALPNLLYAALTQLGNAQDTYETASPTSSSAGTLKDICIGLLLGISLSVLLWLTARNYF